MTQEKSDNESSHSTLTDATGALSTVAQASALMVSAAFVMSVCYDWALLRAVGLQLREVPTSVADHVGSAITWFPGLLVAALLFSAIELVTRRIERGLTEEEIVASSSNPTKTRRAREMPYKLFLMLPVLAIASYVAIGDRALRPGMGFLIALLWVAFAGWANAPPLIQMRRSPALRLGITLIPAVVLGFAAEGYTQSRILLVTGSATHSLIMEANGEPEDVILIKAFEGSLVVVDPTTLRARSILLSHVERLDALDPIPVRRGLFGDRK